MAKEEQILLESIFNTACVIEEGMWDKAKSGMQSIRNKASELRDRLGKKASEFGKKINSKTSEFGNRLGKKAIDVGTNLASGHMAKVVRLGDILSSKADKKINEIERTEMINNAKKKGLKVVSNIGNNLKTGGGLGLGILGLSKKQREKEQRENTNKSANTGSGAGTAAALLGLGLGTGVVAKSLYDKAPDIADETAEHINSLHDKLADVIAAHQEE
jgi:hypothetical protein